MAQKISIAFAQLSFDLEQADGSVLYVVMRELNGKERNEYMKFVNDNVIRDADGKPTGMKSWKRQQTYLLSMCLFPAEMSGECPVQGNDIDAYVCSEKPFTNEVLATWPDKALQVLARSAIALSGLNESPDEAGND